MSKFGRPKISTPGLASPFKLLSHTFPALIYTTRFLSYSSPGSPIPLLLSGQALLVHLFKYVEEIRQGRSVRMPHNLHMARCQKVPENVMAAARIV